MIKKLFPTLRMFSGNNPHRKRRCRSRKKNSDDTPLDDTIACTIDRGSCTSEELDIDIDKAVHIRRPNDV